MADDGFLEEVFVARTAWNETAAEFDHRVTIIHRARVAMYNQHSLVVKAIYYSTRNAQ